MNFKKSISLLLALVTMSATGVSVAAAGVCNEEKSYIDQVVSHSGTREIIMPTYPAAYVDLVGNPLLYIYNNYGWYDDEEDYGRYPNGYENAFVFIEDDNDYRWFEIDHGKYKGERFCLKNNQLVTGLAVIDGKTYCFRDNGLMVRSKWVNCNGDRFYIGSKGYALVGWYSINGDIYYFKKSGAMVKGLVKIKKEIYAFDYYGRLIQNDFVRYGFRVYHTDKKGKIITGWKKIDDEYFYFDSNGVMVTGTVEIDGVWVKFNQYGVYQGKTTNPSESKKKTDNYQSVWTR